MLSLLDQSVEDLGHDLSTLFGMSLLAAFVVNVSDAEPRLVAFGPLTTAVVSAYQICGQEDHPKSRLHLQVVQQRPGHVSLAVHVVECHGLCERRDIVPEVSAAALSVLYARKARPGRSPLCSELVI
jgi:hypothetical protein